MTFAALEAPHIRLTAAALIPAMTLAPACSIRRLAIENLGDALAESSATWSSDDDPDLVREALPFALKLVESLLAESPGHAGLLEAAASGFTQYAWAFVHEEADETADRDYAEAIRLRGRARGLYLRARDYGLRGLELRHEGLTQSLVSAAQPPAEALAVTGEEDLDLLYWTASAWGLAVSVSKDDPERLGEIPAIEALVVRAMEIDPDWAAGSLHEIMIVLKGGRSAAMGGSGEEARGHFERAVELSEGRRASPYVSYAESVSVRTQDRAEFVSLLTKALAVDPDARPEWRLLNLVTQKRARWLLGRADLLFLE